MKPIWELENSENILDRQKYADRVKSEFIQAIEARVKRLEKEDNADYALMLERRFLKNLKIRLSNYDVYNQKMSCRQCGEVVCVCYVIEEKPMEEIAKTLF